MVGHGAGSGSECVRKGEFIIYGYLFNLARGRARKDFDRRGIPARVEGKDGASKLAEESSPRRLSNRNWAKE